MYIYIYIYIYVYIYMCIYIYICFNDLKTCLILNCLLAFPRHVHPTSAVPRLRLAAARSAGASERRRTNSLAPGPWR